jgi:hypothetical protein
MSDGRLTKTPTWRTTTVVLKALLLGCIGIWFAAACRDQRGLVAPTGKAHVPISAAVATTASGATFTTDKDDYAPGETLNLSGAGWQPADVLDIHLDETPQNHPPVDWSVNVDENGAFTDATYVVQESDAGVTFALTATSRATGETATATFTDNGTGSPTACLTAGVSSAAIVDASGSVSPSGVVTVNSASGDLIDITATSGNVISTICIKSGTSTFALAGSGTTANSSGAGDATGTSQHSIPITADGVYGLDLEPSDATAGCYTVSGIGTATVTVTRAPTVDGAPNCKGISHVDVFTTPGGGGAQATSGISTTIHRQNADGSETDVTNGSVTMGATVHDHATVTTTVHNIPAGSSVTFNLYSGTGCTNLVSSVGVNLTGGAMSETVQTANLLITASMIPGISFDATFTSSDKSTSTGVPDAGPSPCENLTVHSSINDFHYHIDGGTTAFTCHTLDANTNPVGSGPDPATCPSSEGSAPVNTSHDYLVHVTVTNGTGVNILEKVQGGLAAKATYANSAGVSYVPVSNVITIDANDITCTGNGSNGNGAATINLSSAKTSSGNTGNVVIWNATGSTNPASAGFAMAPGAVCELTVIVRKTFSSTGNQPVTSSWSELQTLVDGPSAPFSEKSPYTGSLLVSVTP